MFGKSKKFNDYRKHTLEWKQVEYTASDWQWKRKGSQRDQDIVWTMW